MCFTNCLSGQTALEIDSVMKSMVKYKTRSKVKYQRSKIIDRISDLVIDIIVNDPNYEIFLKAFQLAKALLHEGNDKVRRIKD